MRAAPPIEPTAMPALAPPDRLEDPPFWMALPSIVDAVGGGGIEPREGGVAAFDDVDDVADVVTRSDACQYTMKLRAWRMAVEAM
jgi:hypothetical protein